MELFASVVAFLAGLVVGSFLNVVIWRLPRGQNLARPRSACPGCGRMIPWTENLPILSWLALRGRCAGCGMRIALRYPLVELLTGVLFLLAWERLGADLPTAILAALFLAALVAISFIDIDLRIIPDRITKPGMVVLIALAPLNGLLAEPVVAGVKPALNHWLAALLGCGVGAGIILLIRTVGSWILKKEAMGLGDVKLLALIGAMVGWVQTLYALALGCFGGAVIGGLLYAVGKRRPMPCHLEVTGGGETSTFDRVKVRGGLLEVRGGHDLAAGSEVKLDLVLPAARILEDEDARLALRGRIERTEGGGGVRLWCVDVVAPGEIERERLAFFAQSYRYIPFGPFLALGGALAALYGDAVHWFLTEGYPGWVRGLGPL